MQGRKPKPTKLKILQGAARSDRSLKSEIKPDAKIPALPSGLPKEAQIEWGRISQELFDLGLLSEIDRASLVAYCVIWARWIEAERKLKKQGNVIKKKNQKTKGTIYEYQNPNLCIGNKALAQMKVYLVEFGMTPFEIHRVLVPEADNTTSSRHIVIDSQRSFCDT